MKIRRASLSDSDHPLDLKFQTLLDALYFEGKLAGPQRGVTFVDDDGSETRVTYMAALEKSLGRGAALQARGVTPGERVLIVLPTTRDFLYLFFGLLYAGAIPCPLAPPASFAEVASFGARLAAIARGLGAKRVVTIEALESLVAGAIPGIDVVRIDDLRAEAKKAGPRVQSVPIRASDTAMIQCTSGSTGLSKAVQLSHRNLFSNVYQIGQTVGAREDDVTVSWLPLYHDMGLIGCLLFALYWNLDAVFMSPLRFLQRPTSWLEAIAEHRGTLSTAPNFAYGYVASKVTDEEVARLDLSCWRMAACGAEPVDARILRRFTERLRPAGLRPEVFAPCYGLAEATLAVTFHPIGTPLVVDTIDRETLAARGVAVDAAAGDARAIEVVSCGRPLAETHVRIVSESGDDLADDRVGRVLVSGPTVMKGYFRPPDGTPEAIDEDGWLETGDLGYMRDGALRITGRAKDLVIIRGRKYAPSEFEQAAEQVAGVRRGNVVAFGDADPASGTEALVLACETDVIGAADRMALAAQVTASVRAKTGVEPAKVVLIPRGTLPKTSSGKLQRARTRERWRTGELGEG